MNKDLQSSIIESINQSKLLQETIEDQRKEKVLRSYCEKRLKTYSFKEDEKESFIQEIVFFFCGYGPFEKWLRDENVSEIMVNGCSEVFLERGGVIEKESFRFESNKVLQAYLSKMVRFGGKRLDMQHPMVDIRLSKGERVNIVIPPLSLQGPLVTIRKQKKDSWTLKKLRALGSFDDLGEVLLRYFVDKKYNIIFSGGTGSGKTSLMNACGNIIQKNERIISIEDTAEINVTHPHHVALETRAMNVEGKGKVSARSLLKNALRMRPDRIIVGEVRGEEVIDMLQAMNTGHKGSFTTVHANSPLEALFRIETMALMAPENIPITAIRPQVLQAIDIIVQQERGSEGKRGVRSISYVHKNSESYSVEPLYVFGEGCWEIQKRSFKNIPSELQQDILHLGSA